MGSGGNMLLSLFHVSILEVMGLVLCLPTSIPPPGISLSISHDNSMPLTNEWFWNSYVPKAWPVKHAMNATGGFWKRILAHKNKSSKKGGLFFWWMFSTTYLLRLNWTSLVKWRYWYLSLRVVLRSKWFTVFGSVCELYTLVICSLDRRCYSKLGKGMMNLVVLGGVQTGVVQTGMGEAEGKWTRRR